MQEVRSLHHGSPSVSIIMSAYNEEQGIGDAIESIINQTFTDWELIIIDDGSADDTYDIIRHYTDRDNRIRLVHNKTNLGLPASLNKGIKLAHSDLIARADADDINLPERLAIQYEYIQTHPKTDVLGTGAYLLDKQGKRTKTVSLPITHFDLTRLPFQKSHFFHPSVMIRRRFFDKAGLYDQLFLHAEDKELWLRGLRTGCRYANLQEPLIEYSTNEYIRSWNSIINRALSTLRMAHAYNIRWGYNIALKSFVVSTAIKLNIYKPKIIRSTNHDKEAQNIYVNKK